MIELFLDRIEAILKEIRTTQTDQIRRAAGLLTEAIVSGRRIYAFGCNHANILAQELVYRSGGLAVINLIEAPGLALDVRPITLTTDMERLPDYGSLLVRAAGLAAGDVLIVHSVSGRNSVPVDAALAAREIGARVICLTNLQYSQSVRSRHPSGQRLFEVSDLVLDNCGDIGDAALTVPGTQLRVAATSTICGAAILDAMIAETAKQLNEQGVLPPVFMSANQEGGDAFNQRVLETYRAQIRYM